MKAKRRTILPLIANDPNQRLGNMPSIQNQTFTECGYTALSYLYAPPL